MTDPARRSVGTTVALALAIAALLGLAAAGGTLLRGTSTGTTAKDALPYAIVGAACGLALFGIAWAVLRATRPAALRLGIWPLLAIAFLAAALGALVAVALTPDTPSADEVSPLDESDIDERTEQSHIFRDESRAGPVDGNGDGQPDLDADGNPIIGFDIDGDGRLDGYLRPCPEGTPMHASPRPGYTPFDADCDGTIDEWLAFDPDQLLVTDRTFTPTPLDPISPQERQDRADSAGARGQLGGTIWKVLLVVLVVAVAAAIITYIVRRKDPTDPPQPDAPEPSDTDDRDEPDEADAVAQSFVASLDAVLDEPDPRRAICAAYGRLLDGLATAGFARRPEEGPEEHITRCLAIAKLDPRPVRELLTLFAFARFSSHPVTEQHRQAAIRAMQAALN